MNTYIPQHYAAATLFKIGALLHDAARVLRNAAQRLDSFIAARKKGVDDRRVLSEMSERELLDIGMSGAQLHTLRSGWAIHGRESLRAAEWRQPL